jgi:hypothetical protein
MNPTARSLPPLSAADKAAGQRVLLWCVLPFAGPILLSMALVLLTTLGPPLPTLAPGQGWRLVAPGALAALLGWWWVVRQIGRTTERADWRRTAAALALGMSVLSLPVWALGVMQWVNGRFAAEAQATRVPLQGLSTSSKSRSRTPYFWAHLPGDAAAGLPAGRYLLDSGHHAAWTAQPPATVTVHHARGLLGARVVEGLGD